MKAHIVKNLNVNITMPDVDWQRAANGSLDSAIGFDSYDIMDNLHKDTGIEEPPEKSTPFESTSQFFSHVADVIRIQRDLLVVEVIRGIGEVRYGELTCGVGLP